MGCAVVLLLLLLGGWLAYSQMLLRGVLDGESVHDFGTLSYDDGATPLEHSFTLVNRHDVPVVVKTVRADCGCVAPHAELRAIPAGGTWTLPVSMTPPLGPKTVIIRVLFDDGRVQLLRVKAFGVVPPQLVASQQAVDLSPGEPIALTLAANIYNSSEKPEPPVVTSIDGIEAAAGEWKQTWLPKDLRKAPAQWQCSLTITQKIPKAPRNSLIRVNAKGLPELIIAIINQEQDSPAFDIGEYQPEATAQVEPETEGQPPWRPREDDQ